MASELEPEAASAEQSIAISLKRIADVLTGGMSQETFSQLTGQIENMAYYAGQSFARGQR